MQVQPVGSAVNNSNSGALMLGEGYNLVNSLLNRLGPAGQLLGGPLKSIDVSLSQRQAQNITPALIARPGPVAPAVPVTPALAFGGLLAAPGVNNP